MSRYECVLRRLVEIVRIFFFSVCGKVFGNACVQCKAGGTCRNQAQRREVRVCVPVTAVISHAWLHDV